RTSPRDSGGGDRPRACRDGPGAADPTWPPEDAPMNDDLSALRDSRDLHDLLAHYAGLARADRQAWQDRRMEQEGCDGRQLTRLHGRLLAWGWVEQNTGAVTGSYRVTPAGLRALKAVESGAEDE